MADEPQQDRTEQATPKRLADARKEGDVPRSRELTMSGVMLAGGSAVLLLGETVFSDVKRALEFAFKVDRDQIFDTTYMQEALAITISNTLVGLAPLGAIVLIAALLSATLIGGWSFSMKAVAFKGGRMNPIKGIKRIFSANSLNELWKAVAKFGLVAVIAIAWLWFSVDELLSLGRLTVENGIRNAWRICAVSFLVVSSGLIVIALADVPFQLWSYQKKMRMTRQQVRDEFKETEGRPEVKSKIRTLQQQIATRRMMQEVPNADVVVTNPTHYAVALKYDEDRMGAPRVLAKGRGLIAARIREIAEDHTVPLFSAPPLARALYRSTEVGEEIPAGLYTAVAQVLAYIYQLKDSSRFGAARLETPVPDVDEDLY